MPDAIDPAIWTHPALRRALAARDIGEVFACSPRPGCHSGASLS